MVQFSTSKQALPDLKKTQGALQKARHLVCFLAREIKGHNSHNEDHDDDDDHGHGRKPNGKGDKAPAPEAPAPEVAA